MAFEPRFRAGVFNEGGIGLRMSNWFDPWYLTEAMKQHVPVLEHHQLMALIAPRPFLVMGGNSADGDASWAFVKEARSVYELLGAKDRIGLYNHKAGHTFPEPARRLAYQWLDHWLEFRPLARPVIKKLGTIDLLWLKQRLWSSRIDSTDSSTFATTTTPTRRAPPPSDLLTWQPARQLL